MVMDDHAEAEPRRKKDKHNLIVVSNNTINGLMDDDDDVDVCQASSNVPPK
jgi:hypothetical protein